MKRQGTGLRPAKPVQLNSSKKPPSDLHVSIQVSTPIHPNQVVDGIAFVEENNPEYRTSSVFQQAEQENNPELTQERNNTGQMLQKVIQQ